MFGGECMNIEINHLNYENLFQDLNLKIKEKDFITIIGSSSSGKTTLAKLLCGNIPNDHIVIDGNKDDISVVFDHISDNFIYDTVIENLVFPLENRNYSKQEMEEKVNEIVTYLKIEDLLSCNIASLSGGEKEMVAIASSLITNPKLLILDEAFIMLDINQKEKFFKLLKKINREKKTTIVYLTSDVESLLYGKSIAIITNKKIEYGSLKVLLKDEKLFKKARQKLPFMADLSLKLKYYNLIDDIILEESKMVDALWK